MNLDFLCYPLGWVLGVIYSLVNNYGYALLIFTLLIRMILLPLNFKQQKSLVQTNLLKPKLDMLQKQYGNDKERYSAEMMKLYKKHGVNPMSGCLPMLIQLPILFALFYVIRQPLSFMWWIDADSIASIFTKYGLAATDYDAQIKAASMLFADGLQYGINFNFLGILDLSQTPRFDMTQPNFGISLLWVIPIIAAGTTYLSSKFMNIGMDKPKEDETKPKRPPRPSEKGDTAGDMTKGMTMMMPFMTLFFSFTMPAGISIYWIAGNIIQIIQQYIVNKHYVPYIKERMERENDELENDRKKRKNHRRSR